MSTGGRRLRWREWRQGRAVTGPGRPPGRRRGRPGTAPWPGRRLRAGSAPSRRRSRTGRRRGQVDAVAERLRRYAERVVQGLLLKERQQVRTPAPADPQVLGLIAGREGAERRGAVVQPQAELLEVIRAPGAGRGLAHFLDGGEQEGDEDGDDGDDDQELDQREASRPAAA